MLSSFFSSVILFSFFSSSFFFFNDTATTEIYTLSLHDALPIFDDPRRRCRLGVHHLPRGPNRSEEHTSELQSPGELVCRLLLEKKKITIKKYFLSRCLLINYGIYPENRNL